MFATIATLLLVGIIPAPVSPLSPQDENTLVADDIQFVKALANYQYFALALSQIDEIQARKLDGNLEGDAILARAFVFKRASETTSDEAKRLEHQGQAISLLFDWKQPGNPHAFHPRRTEALSDLADLLSERAKTLKENSLAPGAEEVEASKAQALADFKDADETFVTIYRDCESHAEQLAESGQTDAADSLVNRGRDTMLYRGINYLEWAGVSEDPEFYLDKAVDILEEYQWELPDEGMLTQYVAMQYQANAEQQRGSIDDALDLYDQVIEEMTEIFWPYLSTFPEASKAQVARVLAVTYGMKASLLVKGGDLAGAESEIDAMVATHDEVSQPLGRAGHAVLLDWIRTLKGFGQAARGLEYLRQISTNGRGTPEGDLANQFLAQIVEQESGSGLVAASARDYASAADGFRREGKHRDAAYYFTLALAHIETEEERSELETSLWLDLGYSLQKNKRYLVASLAYEHAFEALISQEQVASGETLLLTAARWQQAVDLRYKLTRSPFDRQRREQTRQRLTDTGYASVEGQFVAALELFSEAGGLSRQNKDNATDDEKGPAKAKYLEALAEFQAVEETAPSYERALVYAGRCLAGADDPESSLGAFDVMLNRVKDRSKDPINPESRTKREQALAEALYYKASLLIELGRATEALSTLAEFESTATGQESFIELVKYRRVAAQAMLNLPEETQAAFDDFESAFPESVYVAPASFQLAKTYDAAAQEASGDRARDMRHRAAEAMWAYCEKAGFPSFSNGIKAATWFRDVGQLKRAAESYAATIDRFAESENTSSLDNARIGYGMVLNALHDFGKARALWEELRSRHPDRPTILTGTALCLGGWPDDDGQGTITEIPGTGDYEESFEIWKHLFKGYNVENKYHEVWWQAKLGLVWSQYRIGTQDNQGYYNARKVLENQKLNTPNYDEDTTKNLSPEHQYEGSFRQRFRYLDKIVPMTLDQP